MTKELREKIVTEVKIWAKNNMCASCYSDTETFVDTMNDLIDSDCSDGLINDCLDELDFIGTGIEDNDSWELVYKTLKQEAKFWLNDYYKHKKDYE